jgi:hypothetical protein
MEQNPLIFNNIIRQNNPQIIINQPYKMTFSNIINKMIFTKNCFIITFVICILINFVIYYCFSPYNKESFSFTKFESDDSIFWLFFWMINIEIILISWNFYFFIFSVIFKYDFSKGNGTIRSSIVEDLYKNPLGFVIIIYYYDSKFLKNSIDNSFWMMISMQYYFICFYLIQFYQHFDIEIESITNFSSPSSKKIIPKIKLLSILFLLITILFSICVYILIGGFNQFYKTIILGKSIFIILKLLELYITRVQSFHFLQFEITTKEKYLITNLKKKTFLELITMAFVYYQIVAIFIYSESKPFYFTIISFSIILTQGYHGVLYYKKYNNLKEYYRHLDKSLPKKITNEEICIICTEKLKEARVLNCNHYFHLICLSKWFENGRTTCPICRKEIKLQDDNNNNVNLNNNREQGNQRRVFSLGFRINNSLFSWLPNISMRIVRFNNQGQNRPHIN